MVHLKLKVELKRGGASNIYCSKMWNANMCLK